MKFLSSEKAVSEVVGYAIILGISITGVAMIVLVGVPSIYKLQDMSTIRNMEQTFTLSDSQASGTFLGDAPQRVININPEGGVVTVEPNGTGRESYVVIKSINNTFNITIPMGMVKYTYGDRIIGYEGGGIWSKYPSGGSVMISSPEFHYDGRTLTFPVLTVSGNATVGGKGASTVIFKKNSTQVLFPNTIIDQNRTNPLNYSISGQVYVNITSDFYDAWADYARSLSYTNVSTDSTNRTTSILLTVVPSTLGGSTTITNPISFKGLPSDDTPVDNFSFRIYGKPSGQFLDWDIRAISPSGTKTLIYYIKDTSLTVGYKDTAYSKPVETWGTVPYTPQTDSNGKYIDVDLLNQSVSLTYSNQIPVGSNSGCSNRIIQSSNFNDTAFSWGSNPYTTQSLYNITQHYFWKMAQEGDVFFVQCQSGGLGVKGNSSMVINYNATGAITFLHISNNVADVSMN